MLACSAQHNPSREQKGFFLRSGTRYALALALAGRSPGGDRRNPDTILPLPRRGYGMIRTSQNVAAILRSRETLLNGGKKSTRQRKPSIGTGTDRSVLLRNFQSTFLGHHSSGIHTLAWPQQAPNQENTVAVLFGAQSSLYSSPD